MIKSNLRINKLSKNPVLTQRIEVECDKCLNNYESTYLNVEKGRRIYNQDLCRSCRQKDQYKTGLRKGQSIKAGEAAKRNLSGKSYEDILGPERAQEVKNKLSKKLSGKNNPNYGGKYSHGFGDRPSMKGKTIEQIWGEETGKRLRKHYSEIRKGEKNNMWGKPSPEGSGNGWTGWYKNKLFRSLLELSYIINTLERFNFKWESAENKKYKVEYIDWEGNKRNYYADFIVNGKFLVEIKPYHLHQSKNVQLKKKAAEKFCSENNLKYKLISPAKTLSKKDIKKLIDQKDLIFIDRYKQKYKEL